MAADARPVPRWIYFLFAFLVLVALASFLLASRLRHIDETTRVWVIRELSRHAQGEPTNQEADSAVSDLNGHFHVENAKVTFTNLNFSVEGAAIILDGSYQLHGREIDFHGQLKLQAKLSQTMTGAKSFFLKPFDPFFKKGTSGAVIPITISGTRDNPVFGVSVFHKTIKRELGAQK